MPRILESLRYAPPAWQSHVEMAPFPWWLALNSNGQQVLAHLGLASVQVRSDHTPWHRLKPPLAQLGGLELAASKAIKASLRQMGRRQDRPSAGAADVLALLPQRGWEGQGNARNGFENEYLGPVLRRLADEGHTVATTSHLLEGGMGPAKAWLTALRRGPIGGPPHVWLESFWNASCERAVRETYRHFRRLFAPGTDPHSLGFEADGEAGEQLLAWLRSQSLRLGLYAGWVPAFAAVVKRTEPQAILTTMESFPHHRVMLAAARALNVPSVSLQHGWIGARHAGYMFGPPLDALPEQAAQTIRSVQPDVLAVYGPAVSELLATGPWDAESVVPVGAPRYDTWSALADQAEELRQAHAPDHTLVLWPTQTHGLSAEENDQNVAAWQDLLQRRKDIRLAIKLHPMEPQDAALYAPLERTGALVLGRAEPLAPWLAAADLVVTKNSTCAIEAAALDKPVLVLNLLQEQLGTDFVSSGMAHEARASPLDDAIDATLALPADAREAYVARNLGALDGRASQRVVDSIKPWLTRKSAGANSAR